MKRKRNENIRIVYLFHSIWLSMLMWITTTDQIYTCDLLAPVHKPYIFILSLHIDCPFPIITYAQFFSFLFFDIFSLFILKLHSNANIRSAFHIRNTSHKTKSMDYAIGTISERKNCYESTHKNLLYSHYIVLNWLNILILFLVFPLSLTPLHKTFDPFLCVFFFALWIWNRIWVNTQCTFCSCWMCFDFYIISMAKCIKFDGGVCRCTVIVSYMYKSFESKNIVCLQSHNSC